MVSGCCCFLREFVYIVLLGDEYGMDFLEIHEANVKVKSARNLSSFEEGIYLLAKKLIVSSACNAYLMAGLSLSVRNFMEIKE